MVYPVYPALATILTILVAAPGIAAQSCGICSFRFGCLDQFSCNFDSTADAPAPGNALCDYGPDINRDLVCDEFQTFADIICIDGDTELLSPEGTVPARYVAPGTVLATPHGETTVQRVRRYNQTHHPLLVRAGACGDHGDVTLTEDHAVWCHGKWARASEVGVHAIQPTRKEYVAIETDDYCRDRLLTATGLQVEGWDGREKSGWRPHQYVAGERQRCAKAGTWWELFLWLVDASFERL